MRPLTLWLLLSLPVVADDLIVVTMPTCGPCQTLKKDLLRHPDVTKGHTVKLIEGRDAMKAWDVDTVPTIIRIRDGLQVARKVGHSDVASLREWLNAR